MTFPRPDLDPELREFLAHIPPGPQLTAETLPQIRRRAAMPAEPFLEGRAIERREVSMTAPDVARIPLSVFSPARRTGASCVYWIWAYGGQAEPHVWAGGFHGFDALHPRARLSVAARRTRSEWIARILTPTVSSTALEGAGR
ncbi:hypothetical protein [Sphaerisporangium sp. NPDC051011]|uniref:hypothetical protein n=1 Tax=Sphaerisporangium sp. NPDC051011 TaxID=3155792 RepID=UPI0033F9575A